MSKVWMDEFGQFTMRFEENGQTYYLRWVREDSLKGEEEQVIATFGFITTRIRELILRGSNQKVKT